MKCLLELYLNIDVLDWNRHGHFESPCVFERTWHQDGKLVARLFCKIGRRSVALYSRTSNFYDTRSGQEQQIEVAWTACRYGGERPWFECPSSCGRRVTKLYALNSWFACRHCHCLGYSSQYQAAGERSAWKAHRIRRRLAAEGEISDDFPERPRGMHRRTFNRLRRIHDEAEEAAAQGLFNAIARTIQATASK
ncbi:hypothetical protein [Bradyrhizobium sp. RDT46]|uniref:hypothetical protein n=1 Tax=Bradyrhizobium sp. RDT46 TaxID=3341829 RepID=UPI0035C77B31